MKKANFEQKLICALFCGFLGVMSLLMLFLPKSDYSELEKRELTEFPKFTWQNLISGEFGDEFESYLADHMPGRDFFVGLNAYFDLLTGRQNTKDYFVSGDRLFTAPVQWNQQKVQSNMQKINAFAEKIGQNVDLMIIPSAGSVIGGLGAQYPDYHDGEYISAIYDLAGDGVSTFDLWSLFGGVEDPGSLYYRTDHHWTSKGAWLATAAYAESIGKEFPKAEDFTSETVENFRGACYSSAGLWLIPGENLEMWSTGSNLTVENSNAPGVTHEGIFYRENLEVMDKYTVFLGGNAGLVRIKNADNAGKGKILVIRDSYANCMGGFLAEMYEEVVMVDLRYYKSTAPSVLATQEEFDRVLVCYGIGNFMTDTNFAFLK